MNGGLLDVLINIGGILYLILVGYGCIKILGWLKELKEYEDMLDEMLGGGGE